MPNSVWKEAAFGLGEKIGLFSQPRLLGGRGGNELYALAYHRVENPGDNPWLDPGQISTTPEQFDAQMNLVASDYQPVTSQQVLAAVKGGQPLPPNAVLVTVDDGYRNFKDVILPICTRYGIQPLLFVTTGLVGQGSFWWDKLYQLIYFSDLKTLVTPVGEYPIRENEEKNRVRKQVGQALKKLPFHDVSEWINSSHTANVHIPGDKTNHLLDWDDLRVLKAKGVTIAPHSHTHPILSKIPPDEVRREVQISRDLLQNEIGDIEPVYAIPDGKEYSFDDEVIQIIHSEGFKIIFLLTEARAKIHPGSNDVVLSRLGVWKNLSLAHYHYRLSRFSRKQEN